MHLNVLFCRCIMYSVQKFGVSKIFVFEKLFLFNEDEFKWSKVTVKDIFKFSKNAELSFNQRILKIHKNI